MIDDELIMLTIDINLSCALLHTSCMSMCTLSHVDKCVCTFYEYEYASVF